MPMIRTLMPMIRRPGDLRIVVETPKGSPNKYDYDPDCDCLQLAKVLPEGMVSLWTVQWHALQHQPDILLPNEREIQILRAA